MDVMFQGIMTWNFSAFWVKNTKVQFIFSNFFNKPINYS